MELVLLRRQMDCLVCSANLCGLESTFEHTDSILVILLGEDVLCPTCASCGSEMDPQCFLKAITFLLGDLYFPHLILDLVYKFRHLSAFILDPREFLEVVFVYHGLLGLP